MSNNKLNLGGDNVSEREIKNLNLFWLGFTVYTVSSALTETPFATNIYHAIQILSLIIIVVSVVPLIHFKIQNQYLKWLYLIYLLWSLTIISRGFQTDITSLKDMVYNFRYGLLPYLSPLILIVPKNRFFFTKLIDVIIILAVLYMVLDLIFLRQLLSQDRENNISQGIMEIFGSALSIPAGFILLTYKYHSNKKKIFAIFILVLSLFFAIIRARRGLIFIYSSTLISFYDLYTFYSKRKYFIFYLTILVGCIGMLYVSNVYKLSDRNIFKFVLDRGDENTREVVELYFYTDLKTADWILGRGINGQYFCPDIEENQLTNYRNVIETDYLQIILNGGLISLGLLLLILIPAIFLGMFYSSNILSKGSAIWILLWILYLYPARVSTFTLHYLLVWISVGICYSKSFRSMSEEDIKHLFSS